MVASNDRVSEEMVTSNDRGRQLSANSSRGSTGTVYNSVVRSNKLNNLSTNLKENNKVLVNIYKVSEFWVTKINGLSFAIFSLNIYLKNKTYCNQH